MSSRPPRFADKKYGKRRESDADFKMARTAVKSLGVFLTMSSLLELLGQGIIRRYTRYLRSHFLTGRFAALRELQKAVADQPCDMQSRWQLGLAYLRQFELSRAIEQFREIEKTGRVDVALLAALGAACNDIGLVDDATAYLRAALDIEGEHVNLWFALGLIREKRDDKQEAGECYARAIALNPKCRMARCRMAAMAYHAGDHASACEQYLMLRDQDPGDFHIRMTLGHLWMATGEPRRALAEFEIAITIEPDNWAAHNELVAALEEAGLYDDAIQEMHHILETQADYPDLRVQLADLYLKTGQIKQAGENLAVAVDGNPRYLEALVKSGAVAVRLAEYQSACQYFSQAIDVNDSLLTAYVGLAVAQQQLGRGDEALAALEMAAGIEPNTAALFGEVARLQLDVAINEEIDKQFALPDEPHESPDDEAMDRHVGLMAKTVESRPNHADLHYRYGLMLRARGDLEAGAEQFEIAVEINPTYVKALIKLGLTYRQLGRNTDAISLLRRSVSLEPEYADLHYQLGLTYADVGKFGHAVESYEEALHQRGKNPELYANMALALEQMGLLEKSNSLWKEIDELWPKAEQADLARRRLALQGSRRARE